VALTAFAICTLKRTQRADGFWANQENLVKEDDPLIATGVCRPRPGYPLVRSRKPDVEGTDAGAAAVLT
jgi:hypothetical protein